MLTRITRVNALLQQREPALMREQPRRHHHKTVTTGNFRNIATRALFRCKAIVNPIRPVCPEYTPVTVSIR
ncbi:hypothetical protein [Desulfopila sp. IMCC35008]|uniref:hypothetical protein n=1 Tax=Desulfopila sp. IMCC35008 TaxID=2653858 RepID=UPI0013CFB0FF|nr:hypothetical protein [Desulfopila sp. IMCC35008]